MENTVSSGDGCFIDFIRNILHYIPTCLLSITSSFVPDMDMNTEINIGLKSFVIMTGRCFSPVNIHKQEMSSGY